MLGIVCTGIALWLYFFLVSEAELDVSDYPVQRPLDTLIVNVYGSER
jgi:hypothetical protein